MPLIGSRRAKLALINLYDGSVGAIIELANRPSTATILGVSVYNDGLNVHAEYFDSVAGSLVIAHCTPNGNTFVQDSSEVPPVNILDVCFDGKYYWFLTATTVYQVEGPFGTSKIANQWNHGLSNATGIMTDGNNIIIMET